MGKSISLFLMLALGMMVTFGPLAARAASGLSGDWSGAYDCEAWKQGKGTIKASFKEGKNKVTGTVTLEKTVKGNLGGPFEGFNGEGYVVGYFQAAVERDILFKGILKGNTMHGIYATSFSYSCNYNMERK